MSALVDLLALLQTTKRVDTAAGQVIVFDAQSTRALDDAIAQLDAQMSRDLSNLDGFPQRPPPKTRERD